MPAARWRRSLALAAGERVAAVGAPPGFAAVLGALPKGTRLTADLTGDVQRFVWFVKSRRELEMALARLTRSSRRRWLAGVAEEGLGRDVRLDGNDRARKPAWPAGFVDFKVCSIDATWSGLAFKRARR